MTHLYGKLVNECPECIKLASNMETGGATLHRGRPSTRDKSPKTCHCGNTMAWDSNQCKVCSRKYFRKWAFTTIKGFEKRNKKD